MFTEHINVLIFIIRFYGHIQNITRLELGTFFIKRAGIRYPFYDFSAGKIYQIFIK